MSARKNLPDCSIGPWIAEDDSCSSSSYSSESSDTESDDDDSRTEGDYSVPQSITSSLTLPSPMCFARYNYVPNILCKKAHVNEFWHASGYPPETATYKSVRVDRDPIAGDIVLYNQRLYFYQPNGRNSCYLYIQQTQQGMRSHASYTPSKNSVFPVRICLKAEQL